MGLCVYAVAREGRRWKIDLCNLVGNKKKGTVVRQKRVGGEERRGAGRLSNYPFKPNLRCCLKLTYANEVAKSHGDSESTGTRWVFTSYHNPIKCKF